MSVIHIETTIDSDTLYLPQLKSLVGKIVEITVREKAVPKVTPSTGASAAIGEAVRQLEDYDFNAYRDARNKERQHSDKERP
jgi:hypothetical protein